MACSQLPVVVCPKIKLLTVHNPSYHGMMLVNCDLGFWRDDVYDVKLRIMGTGNDMGGDVDSLRKDAEKLDMSALAMFMMCSEPS